MSSTRTFVGRAVCAPLFHFFAIGGLLFVLRSAIPEPGALVDRQPLVVSAERLEALRADFVRLRGRTPSPEELKARIEEVLDEELLDREARRLDLGFGDQAVRQRLVGKMRAVTSDLSLSDDELYRQALDLGLDHDVVIRRQLREKMRLLLRRGLLSPARAGEPSEAELAACLERNRDRFARPASVSFTHVFVSSSLHGATLDERAAAVATEIRSRSWTPEQAVELADPFPLPAHWKVRTRADLARRFGDGFARDVSALEPGTWSTPVASLFGRHVVYVHEKRSAGLPPLDDVRDQVRRILEEERSTVRLAEGLERLRDLYQVRVEQPETRMARTEVSP